MTGLRLAARLVRPAIGSDSIVHMIRADERSFVSRQIPLLPAAVRSFGRRSAATAHFSTDVSCDVASLEISLRQPVLRVGSGLMVNNGGIGERTTVPSIP